MKWLRFAIPLAVFAVLVFFLGRGLQLDPRAVPSPLVGKPAPAFALARLDDAARTIRREDFAGEVWLLNVWASWCTGCAAEHPALLAFARQRSVRIVGLNYKDERGAATRWLARHGDPYAMSLHDGDGRAGIDFGVYGVPETFVIDRAGVVRFKHVGPLDAEIIRGQLVPLLETLHAKTP